ncbi:MAG: complex I subunit 4 family protein [Candidatus Hodarchaeales archaeon]|jgi:NADH-quinone oxidoreductase subunit M
MSEVNYILSAIFLLPIIGSVITFVLTRKREQYARIISLFFALVVFLITIIAGLAYLEAIGSWTLLGDSFFSDIFPAMVKSDYTNTSTGFSMVLVDDISWIEQVGINYFLGIDGLSIPLVILSGFITICAILASPKDIERAPLYYMLVLMLETGIMGVFLALDFFLFFIAWELVLVPMFFLIGIWGGPKREYAAIYFFIYTHVASLVLLLAIVGLWVVQYDVTNGVTSFSMLTIASSLNTNWSAVSTGIITLIFFSLLFGFIVKCPSVPFHTWLPLAHVEAPSPISMILAGLLLKLGGYGLIRINYQLLPRLFADHASIIAVIGLISLFWGGFVALRQTDLKRLVAMSSVAHMGMVLFGAAISASTGRPEGLLGAQFMMIAHGLISPALFNMVGVLQHSANTREIDAFRGLTQKMPNMSFLLVYFSMASLGLPGLAGFVSEFYVFLGGFMWKQTDLHSSLDYPFFAFIAIFGVVVTVAFYLWMLQRIVWGTPTETVDNAHMPYKWEYWSLVLLAIPVFLLGVFPFLLLTPIDSTFNLIAGLTST